MQVVTNRLRQNRQRVKTAASTKLGVQVVGRFNRCHRLKMKVARQSFRYGRHCRCFDDGRDRSIAGENQLEGTLCPYLQAGKLAQHPQGARVQCVGVFDDQERGVIRRRLLQHEHFDHIDQLVDRTELKVITELRKHCLEECRRVQAGAIDHCNRGVVGQRLSEMPNNCRLAGKRRTLKQAETAISAVGLVQEFKGVLLRGVRDKDQRSPVGAERLLLQSGFA